MKLCFSVIALFVAFSEISSAAPCGVDANAETFRTKVGSEIALEFPILPLKGTLGKSKKEVKEFFDLNFRLPRAYQQTLDRIESLAKAKKLHWIGVESAAALGIKDIPEAEKTVAKAQASKKEKEKLLLLLLGPVTYFKRKIEPKLAGVKIPVMALAQVDEEIDRAETVHRQIDQWSEKLLKDSAGSGLKSSEMEKLLAIKIESFFAGHLEASQKTQLDQLLTLVKTDAMKKLLKDFDSWIQLEGSRIQKREVQILKSALSFKDSGVIVLSRWSEAGIVEALANSCRAGKSNP